MAKYIEREALVEWLKRIPLKDLSDGRGLCRVIFEDDFKRAIKKIPKGIIVDVSPVRHGRWLHTEEPLGWKDVDCMECSACHDSWIIEEDCCFDDMPLCTYITPTLTTVHVPKQYMGEIAVKRLSEMIANPSASPVKIEIATSLIKRKSC